MVANIRGYTPNYGFKLINFDTPRWHTLEYANWGQLDAMLLQLGTPNIRGEWINSTHYLAGERVYDAQTSDVYRCLVEHISPATGTFAEARAATPGYWALQTLGVPLFRGAWLPGVNYTLGDLVTIDTYTYYLCTTSHVSGTTFYPDIFNWTLVFDALPAVNNTQQSADSAATSANNASISEGNAFTSATNAAISASDALSSATSADLDANTAVNAANTAATEADAAEASAIAAANSADGLKGTSTTSNLLGLGVKTFTTQAGKQFNVGNFMTIVDAANPTGNIMTGNIVSYSSTTLQVNITGLLGTGTIANWLLYISGMQGQKGADGSGGGGIPEAPSDGILYARLNATWSAAVKRSGDTMTGPLLLPVLADADPNTYAATKKYVDDKITATNTVANAKVAKAGDTMTGDLTISKANAGVILAATTAGGNSTLVGSKLAKNRWIMEMGSTAAESSGNAGSDFTLLRFNDAGDVILGMPISINRASGKVQVETDPTDALGVATKQYVDGKIPVIATAAEYLANSAPTKMLTPGAVWTAADQVALADAATVTPNFAAGIQFYWILGAAGRTLTNPINYKAGQSGIIAIIQDSTGGRTITSWGTTYKFPGGIKPTLSTAPNAVDVLFYYCMNSSNTILCNFLAGFA